MQISKLCRSFIPKSDSLFLKECYVLANLVDFGEMPCSILSLYIVSILVYGVLVIMATKEIMVHACADPESFVRGGPTLTFFKLMRRGRIQMPLFNKQTSIGMRETRFACIPMMAGLVTL